MSKRKKFGSTALVIFVILSFTAGFFACRFLYAGSAKSYLSQKQSRAINQAFEIVNKYSIDEQDKEHNIDYALKGLAASLDDKYAYYFTPEELQSYEKITNGTVSGGIGVTVVETDEGIVVSSVYNDFGAHQAGIKPGDIFLSVNGENVKTIGVDELSDKIEGEPGTQVDISVERDGKVLNFFVMRTEGQRQMAEYKMLDNGILYIKMIAFHGNLVEYFNKAIAYGEENNYSKILIDLRENGGGEVSVFEKVADIILPEGETFYAMTRTGEKIESCHSDAKSIDKPICVLIDQNTASAAEALAGALRDMGDAVIVGTNSYGKGVMQTSFKLANGGVFKLTIGKYYLPSGICIDENGIIPDYEVKFNDDLDSKYWLRTEVNDLQLKKAIEVLTKQ